MGEGEVGWECSASWYSNVHPEMVDGALDGGNERMAEGLAEQVSRRREKRAEQRLLSREWGGGGRVFVPSYPARREQGGGVPIEEAKQRQEDQRDTESRPAMPQLAPLARRRLRNSPPPLRRGMKPVAGWPE